MYSYSLLSYVNHYVTNRNMHLKDTTRQWNNGIKLHERKNKCDWLFKIRDHNAKVIKASVSNTLKYVLLLTITS
jgi:hypothetical protein